jgi:hypothetical protein
MMQIVPHVRKNSAAVSSPNVTWIPDLARPMTRPRYSDEQIA